MLYDYACERQSKTRMAAGISETGAQLLVRLGAKSSLKPLDAHLFPPPDILCPGSAVEFYGLSGCGKTEMLLHLVSNCILPKTWQGATLGGLGVGVIFVDADFQFSMLRLFHILERRIAEAFDGMKEGSQASGDKNGQSNFATELEQSFCEVCKKQRDNVGSIQNDDAHKAEICLCEGSRQSGKKRTRSGNVKPCCGDGVAGVLREQAEINNHSTHCDIPMPDETEVFIKTCLNRFYLVRSGGSSSDQLVVTLHSLESLITSRPDVSVLMLENIAAFYWIDRMNGGVALAQEANQRRVADIIKRLLDEYQLVLLATKPALVQRNRKRDLYSSPTTRQLANVSNAGTGCDHHEFMCNAWNKLISHRFVLSRQEHVVYAQNRTLIQSRYTATRILPTPNQQVKFSITNRGIVY